MLWHSFENGSNFYCYNKFNEKKCKVSAAIGKYSDIIFHEGS